MRLADAARPHKKKAAVDRRVFARQAVGVVEGAQLRAVVRRGLIVRERALLVTARDVRGLEQHLSGVLSAAAATPRPLARRYFHPGAEADGADYRPRLGR